MYLGKKTKQALLNHQRWFKHELLNIVCEQQMSSNWWKLVNKQQLSSAASHAMQALLCGLARAAKGQAWQRRWLRALIFLMNFKAEVSWSNEELNLDSYFSESGWARGAASGTREDPVAALSHPGAAGNQSNIWRQPWSSQPTMKVVFKDHLWEMLFT